MIDFLKEADIAMTVCDREGRIIYMNNQSKEVNQKPGTDLMGKNILDCHPEPARSLLVRMMENGEKHVYTIEKNSLVRRRKIHGLCRAVYDYPL